MTTPRERIKALSEMLRSLGAGMEYALTSGTEFEPKDIYIDLTEKKNQELIFDSSTAPGVAIQSLSTMSYPPPGYGSHPKGGVVDLSGIFLYINRKNGPIFQVGEDDIYIHYPIYKVYMTNPGGRYGILHLRVYRDPLFLLAVAPKSLFRYYNSKGVPDDLATENTLTMIKDLTDLIEQDLTGLILDDLDLIVGNTLDCATSLSEIEPDVDQIRIDTADIKADVSQIQGDVSQIQLDTADIKADISQIQSDVSQIATDTADIKNQGANSSEGFSSQYDVGTLVVQGDNYLVPDGKAIAIWADPDNTDEVALSFDGFDPVVGTNAGLKAGQGIAIQLTNVNLIKMVAASGTQKINIVVEG